MKQTIIPLIILTDDEHRENDTIERVRQEIEMSGLHLQSLFNFIARSAQSLESEFSNDEAGKVSEFCYDLMNFSDIGNSLAMAIWKSISDLTEIQTKDESEILAEKISFLITAENLPSQISQALQDAVTDICNASKQMEISEFEKSPEYIAKVLRDYQSE